MRHLWSPQSSEDPATEQYFLPLSFRAVPVCLSEAQRFPFQHHLVPEWHHGGQVQFLLRVPLCSRLSARQEELLQADLAGWWHTLLQVRSSFPRDMLVSMGMMLLKHIRQTHFICLDVRVSETNTVPASN